MRPTNLPVYIFDLDGTLALVDHRRHLVEAPKCPRCNGFGRDVGMHHNYVCEACDGKGKDRSFKPDWKGFYAACVDDQPNYPVIETLQHLAIHNDIWIWSGRSDEVRWATHHWLQRHVRLHQELRMRNADDFTPDEQLKKSWLDGLPESKRKRIRAVFDDRDKVVKMWRDNGVPCFQVAPGNF